MTAPAHARRLPLGRRHPARTYDVCHVSSAHRWTDNRVHLREAATTAERFATLLVAVDDPTTATGTGVDVVLLPRRPRLRRMVLGSVSALTVAVRSGARVLHLHDPELVWAIPLLRALGRRVVYDAHEDLPDQVSTKTYLPRAVRGLVVRACSLVVRLAGTSDHVVAATPVVARRFAPHKTTVVHNYPRLRAAEDDAPDLLDRPLRATYLGVVSEARGSRAIAAAAVSGSFPDGWTVDVVGNLRPDSEAEAFREAEAAGRVVVHGLVSPEEARDRLLEARVGLVVLMPTPAYRVALATKMFEYMAAGMPVIASDFDLWRELLAPHDCAQFVDPADPEQLAVALRRYADDPDLLRRQGRNARRAAVEVFNWATEARALTEVYERLGLEASSSSRPTTPAR